MNTVHCTVYALSLSLFNLGQLVLPETYPTETEFDIQYALCSVQADIPVALIQITVSNFLVFIGAATSRVCE
jgi:hypothetical protein